MTDRARLPRQGPEPSTAFPWPALGRAAVCFIAGDEGHVVLCGGRGAEEVDPVPEYGEGAREWAGEGRAVRLEYREEEYQEFLRYRWAI